jgi:uncharacterized protein YndB with AHSA1/START domain
MLSEAEVQEAISLSLEREYNTTTQALFNAWSNEAQLKTWFCPGTIYVDQLEMDFRVGGGYRMVMKDPDGNDYHTLTGEYLEIDEPNKIVFTFQWVTKEASPVTLVTLLFDETAGGCKMTLIHERFADEKTRDLHIEGWSASFPKLEKLLQQ